MSDANIIQFPGPPPNDGDPEDRVPVVLPPPRRRSPGKELVHVEVGELEDAPVPVERTDHPLWIASRRLHPRVRQMATSSIAEHAVVALAGLVSWSRYAWDGATHGVYRRQIRTAEATNDSAAVELWTARREEAIGNRHARLLQAPRLVLGLLAAVGLVIVACFVAVLLAGVLAAMTGMASFGAVMRTAGGVVAVLLWAGVAVAVLSAVAAPVVVFLLAWREGRRAGGGPGWVAAQRAEDDAETVVVTPLGVAEAVAHLNIPSLDKAIRDGWHVAFDTPPMRVNNRGYQTVFSLPMGVTPTMVADKREVLARNLHRDTLEVWPTAAPRPGFVDLWVADSGSAARPTPEYPLLHEGQADVFAGVPAGIAQRGDEIAFPVVGANWVAGGRMGQGKSNLCRVVMLGCATDPLADLWVHVFAGNGDFDAYRPRLARYLRGADDDIIWAGLHSLQELYEETGRREARLAELGAKKVTRGLADKHSDLRPIIALFSECHELFGSDLPLYEGAPKSQTVGKAAAEYATKTVKRARKTGITLGFDTQSSRADAIPPKIVELVGVNACFSVKTWRSNDGFLGDGSFQAGIRATELRFNVDRGTCLVTGTTDETFEVMKTFFIEVDDDAGRDDAAPVIARCMAEAKDRGRPPAAPERPVEQRDLLEDVAAVLDDVPVPAAEVPARLKRLAPAWAPYRSLTGKELRRRLDDEYGLVVPSTGNRWPVSPDAVRAVVSDRRLEEADLTE